MSHHRVAAGYLRTGNVDLAVLELEGMREAWGKVSHVAAPGRVPRQAELHRHDARHRGAPDRHHARAQHGQRRCRARIARRDPQVALRRCGARAASTVLADCVLDANIAMDALFAHDGKAPDWDERRGRAPKSYRATLQRCDGMAPRGIRGHAEFRRLIDGALASLAQMPKAVETRDTRPAAPPADRIALVRSPAGVPLRLRLSAAHALPRRSASRSSRLRRAAPARRTRHVRAEGLRVVPAVRPRDRAGL